MWRISKQPLYLPGNRQCSVATKQFQWTKWIKVRRKIVEIQDKSMRKMAAWRNLTEEKCSFSPSLLFFRFKIFLHIDSAFRCYGLSLQFRSLPKWKTPSWEHIIGQSSVPAEFTPWGLMSPGPAYCICLQSRRQQQLRVPMIRFELSCCTETSSKRMSSLCLCCLFSFLTCILPPIISQ